MRTESARGLSGDGEGMNVRQFILSTHSLTSVDHGDAGRGEGLDHAPAEFIEVVERGRGRCVDGCVDLSGDIGYGCGNGVWVWLWVWLWL